MATLAPPSNTSHVRSNSSPSSIRPQLNAIDTAIPSPTKGPPKPTEGPRKPNPTDQMPQKGGLAKRSKDRAMSDPSPPKPKLFGLFKKSEDTDAASEKKKSKKEKKRERRDSAVRFAEEPEVIPYIRRGDSWLSTIIEHPESPMLSKKFWSR